MADHTGIEWTDATWNPVVGCSIVSPGCTNCYAMGQAARQVRCSEGLRRPTHYAGTVETVKGKPVWTGKLALAPDHILTQPLRWKRGRRIFVNSIGDLFHEDVPDEWIDRVFAVMALAPQHTFQILTKRSARMRSYMSDPATIARLVEAILVSSWNDPGAEDCRAGICYGEGRGPSRAWRPLPKHPSYQLDPWPLPNVWLGISAEDQRRADERIPDLLATPAAIRFVSAEPLLGPIDFQHIRRAEFEGKDCYRDALAGTASGSLTDYFNLPKLDWIIVGGESGKGARPMHPDWARSIRDQCASAGTAFFFKQWGEFSPEGLCSERHLMRPDGSSDPDPLPNGIARHHKPGFSVMYRIGKARAGRLLDGVTHDAMPELRHG